MERIAHVRREDILTREVLHHPRRGVEADDLDTALGAAECTDGMTYGTSPSKSGNSTLTFGSATAVRVSSGSFVAQSATTMLLIFVLHVSGKGA